MTSTDFIGGRLRSHRDAQPKAMNHVWLVVAALSVLILGATAVPYLFWLEPAVPTMVAGIAFAVVGGVLAVRRPDNAIGGLLVAMGAVWAVGEEAYTYLESAAAGVLPPSDLVTWINAWAFYLMLPLLVAVVAKWTVGSTGLAITPRGLPNDSPTVSATAPPWMT